MEHQRILQLVMNWLQVNNYLQHEAEQWTTGKDAKKIHPGRYNVVGRDPFYVTDSELPIATLIGLKKNIERELERRKK